jgi:hypothetical protein
MFTGACTADPVAEAGARCRQAGVQLVRDADGATYLSRLVKVDLPPATAACGPGAGRSPGPYVLSGSVDGLVWWPDSRPGDSPAAVVEVKHSEKYTASTFPTLPDLRDALQVHTYAALVGASAIGLARGNKSSPEGTSTTVMTLPSSRTLWTDTILPGVEAAVAAVRGMLILQTAEDVALADRVLTTIQLGGTGAVGCTCEPSPAASTT